MPTKFIQKLDELFKIWKDKYEIFDKKYFQGLFIYTYDYNLSNEITKYYNDYLRKEIDNYITEIISICNNDINKIKNYAKEYGLLIDCEINDIFDQLRKIKKMELLLNLAKDIDGKECDISKINDKETSKIQKILEKINENFNNKDSQNEKDTENNSINNNVKKDISNDKDIYNDDIDGEPL